MCLEKRSPTLKKLAATYANFTLHGRKAHLQVLLWNTASKEAPTPIALDITLYSWEISAVGLVMSIVASKHVTPPMLLDIGSCNCRADGIACSWRNCRCHNDGLSSTEYCECDGTNGNAITYSLSMKEKILMI